MSVDVSELTPEQIEQLPRSQRNRILRKLRKQRKERSYGEVEMSDRTYWVARDGSFRRLQPKQFRSKKERMRARRAAA